MKPTVVLVHGAFAESASWERVIDSLLEDDLTVTPAFKEHCSQLLEQADTGNWGFIYFGHRVNASAPEVPRLFQYDGPIATTHFYAVNKTVFDPLIDYLQAVQLRAPGDPADRVGRATQAASRLGRSIRSPVRSPDRARSSWTEQRSAWRM